MPKLSSLTDLRALRDRITQDEGQARPTIIVCAGTACQASESNRLIRAAKRHLLMNDLVEKVKLRVTGCHGFCEMGPFLLTEPQRAFYVKLHHYHVPRIIDAMLAGEYVEDLLYQDPGTGKRYKHADEIPFFNSQQRTLLAQNQAIDPIRLFDYLAAGGYTALEKVIEKNEPAAIIDEIKRSKLRGRGGAGFLAGRKWELAAQQDGTHGKFVVCNADEGDPGAYMDRSLLEGNPHSVIEGMIIGGLAMGATEGFIFVRHEYPQAIKNSLIGLRMAREFGLLGDDILGSGINFDIHIVKSAGAFVCGEETALIKTIEGYIGEPIQRPPFPIERGINGRPTCINNVETWANVPVVIRDGADEYAKVGTQDSTGTKVFSLVGKIRNTGLVEVPMGMPITTIVNEIGGGAKEGHKLKAVQIGGPSGGCIPNWKFELPVDYDSLNQAGAIMGSGGMIAMDDDTCMVDVAKYFMDFLRDESCGKCFTCRKGTQRMHELLEDICSGNATLDTLNLLEELAVAVRDTTMCGLGQSAPNPVLSTLRHFRKEYEQHIVEKRCEAFVCKDLVGAPCQSACPVGTEAWRYVAHIGNGEFDDAYRAIRATNPFPSVCARVCDHKCESRCRLGTSGDKPVAIRALKRFITDTVDPSAFVPERSAEKREQRVAVVGAGPAGLTAAHELSLAGYEVTLIDQNPEPGGMLVMGIPSYRLPRDVLRKEVDALIDDNITLQMDTTLGADTTVDQLFEQGHAAVFVAMGALKSRRLGIEGEDGSGLLASMEFLRTFNLGGDPVAKGRVGVVGGGNSAIDAARIALRQPDVDEVVVLYRRTREEMPAFAEEIDAALDEGVQLQTLVSPEAIERRDGKVVGVRCIQNDLGPRDDSGRRRPVPIEGSETTIALDTVIAAIGEMPNIESLRDQQKNGVVTTRWGSVEVEGPTLATGRPGLFAGGDVVTGPNTVIDAVAAGRKAAQVIDRYLRGESLEVPCAGSRPSTFVQSLPQVTPSRTPQRACIEHLPQEERVAGFDEVEKTLTQEAAQLEATRCLRCDLDFTRPVADEQPASTMMGGQR